ncbi:MAG: hypothetical protein MJ179_07965 [Treponema sp.]|nr:hypothetical protein [Treponema sp.]
MSKSSGFSIGRVLLQIALGLLLTVAGIWTFMGGGDEGVSAIRNIIGNKTLETILIYAYGVIEIISGIFLILALFIGDRLGTFGNILMIIIMIVWIIAIVLMDFLGAGSFFKSALLPWLYRFAGHLMILGSIIYLRK